MNKTVQLLIAFVLTVNVFPSSALADDQYTLPTSEEGLPGEGALRRYDGYVKKWAAFRSAWSQRIEQDQKSVVFLGDSITQGWGTNFKDKFHGMKLANRGIGGDTTRGMLIRLQQDVLSLNPSVIVLLMGTNDIEVGIEADAIGRNFEKIIQAIKQHNSMTPIVLCRMFPSSGKKKRPKEIIQRVNQLFEATVKGDSQITVVDTWTLFADAEGDADPQWFPDLLHLNAAGYDRWAAALRPIFATLGHLDTEPDDFKPEPGYVSLFNGRDLTGWGFRPTPPRRKPKKPRPNAPVFVQIKKAVSLEGKVVSDDGRYAAINGRLVVTTPPEGRRIQQLWTTEEFGDDFTLKLEFRATPNADSGVFIRKPQLQCRDFLLAGPYKELKKYRVGGWNELTVTVKAGVARATCNGELLTDDMAVPESGPIGLEGDRGQIEYRRIRLKRLQKADTSPTVGTLDQSLQEKTTSLNPQYLVFASKVDPDTASPLLIYLHGAGGVGNNIHKLKGQARPLWQGIETFGKGPCIVVAPQCLKNGKAGGGWIPQDLNILLGHLKATLNIDENRIYLTGNSMGGYGSWVWGGHNPEHFAAIAPVSGGIGPGGPKDVTPDLEKWAANLAKVPVHAFAGGNDRVVPAERSERMIAAIQKAGGQEARLKVHPDEGHGAGRVVFSTAEFYEWMFSKKRDQHTRQQ